MKKISIFLFACFFIIIAGCSVEKEAKVKDIQLTTYAEEVGFSLETPQKEKFETKTVIDMSGELQKIEGPSWEHIWVVVTSEESIDELESDEFNYYIPIEKGAFSEQITLHNGAGEYEINIRVPSNKSDEESIYYDVATFDVLNKDEEVKRSVEYTSYGAEDGIQLTSPEFALEDSEGSIYMEGTVPKDHQGDMVLLQVEKESETRQIMFKIENNSFSGNVPLYFGEGFYTVRVQTYNEDDEFYYESASFHANNQVDIEYAEIEKYNEYVSRGVSLIEPTWNAEAVRTEQEYPIAGKVDPDISGADEITYIIVSVTNTDEDVESSYLIPVENYEFDGLAYFRFGPGNYNVTISVPDLDQQDQSMFYYQGIVQIKHRVEDIKDERGLLPSRGIESDHPAIIEQAKKITADLSSAREKAKAIYKFVAQHVAYDVQKAENDAFNIGDSAVSALESGNGICQDYAFLATALLRAIGMESYYVEGDAGERHAWVEVSIDGEMIEMDPTWGAGYVEDGVFRFHYNEDYFDPDPAFLAETHTRDGVMY